jgi:xylulokinase
MITERILAFDVGTSGVKAVLTDTGGRILDSAHRSYGLQTSGGGWVSQNLDEILSATSSASRELIDRLGGGARTIVGVGATAQMFNLVPVDVNGRALIPMISWLDLRAAPDAVAFSERMPRSVQFRKLGAVVSGKDILPKILWLRDRRPEVFARTAKLLDCKEAVVLGLTGRAVADYAGASAYRLVDPATRAWDSELLDEIGVARDLLPDVTAATAVAGQITKSVAEETGLIAGTPMVVGAGDVPASQVGAGAIGPGDTQLSLGTAVYFGVTLDHPAEDPSRQLGVIGHMDPNLLILWLEIATGGGALTWLRRNLGAVDFHEPNDHAEIELRVAECGDAMAGLLFAPWLSGERTPVFDDSARAAFVGLGLEHGPAHLLRAVMEGVAFQMRWALEYGSAFGQPIEIIRSVGGGTIGNVWIQIMADILGRPLKTIRDPQHAGAVGAAACTLVGLGLQEDFQFVRDLVVVDREFLPDPNRREAYSARYQRFRQLYDALRLVDRPLPAEADSVHDQDGYGA